MRKLIDLLKLNLNYSSRWAIYAELINGEFKPESNARIGQRIFENGGVLDDCVYFANNEYIVDQITNYTDLNNDFLEEAIIDLLEKVNGWMSQSLNLSKTIIATYSR